MKRYVLDAALFAALLFAALAPGATDLLWLAGRIAGLFGLVVLSRAYAPTVLEILAAWVDSLSEE